MRWPFQPRQEFEDHEVGEGKLFTILDKTPIEKLNPDSVVYIDAANQYHVLQEDILIMLDSYARNGQRSGNIARAMHKYLNQYPLWNLSTELSPEQQVLFVNQFIRGKLTQVCCVDSFGGSSRMSSTVQKVNQFAAERNNDVVGFFRSQACSAALLVAMDIPKRFTTSRTRYAWHFGRYVVTTKDPLEQAEYCRREDKQGRQSAAEFDQFLAQYVCEQKRDEVRRRFQSALASPNPTFTFYGSDLAEWGMAELLSDKRMPSQVLQENTGVNIATLPHGSLKDFFEQFDRQVDKQSLITPCF